MSRGFPATSPGPGRSVAIRPAKIADIPAIADCGARFVAMSGCADLLPETHGEIVDAIGRLMAIPGVKVWLAEAGAVLGGLGMIIGPSLWRPSLLHAEELFFWVEPSSPGTTALRLLRAATAEMRAQDVTTQTFFALPTSPRTVQRLYATMGLRPVQTAYLGFVTSMGRIAEPSNCSGEM